MGIFGGGLFSVIKYEGGRNVLAWKYPNSNLTTKSQLIVNESQEAVLYKGGQALDVFQSGRHTLTTDNIPLLSKIVNIPFGGNSPFTAEVWFVNKAVSLDIKWGTPTPIQLEDPKFGIFIPVTSFGQFGIQVSNSKKFLEKLVGTMPLFTNDQVVTYFRGLYLTKVKNMIASYIRRQGIPLLDINAYIDELSQTIRNQMTQEFDEYGISLASFYINDISVPDDDPSIQKLKESMSSRADMQLRNYSYQQERSFDTMEKAAENEGNVGGYMGIGMGFGIGGTMGQQMSYAASAINTAPTKQCPKCGAQIPSNQRFCGECGSDTMVTDVVKCYKCNKPISENTKFCPHCGAPMKKKCSNCGTELDGSLNFCSNCGEKL